MKRISTLVLGGAIALSSITTSAKAFDLLPSLLIGAGTFALGSYYGKKWEREDPRRNRVIMQPAPQYQPQQESVQYVNAPTGMYYYQPTMYTYEPQRVIIRDSY